MTRSTLPRMVLRGLLRRCPWCGGRGAFFSSWYGKEPACRTCGLRWRRDDVGFELGAAAVAAIIVMGPLIIGLAITLAVLWPEVPVAPLLAVFLSLGLILPLILYPISYTVWQAIDVMMRPVTPDDFDVSHLDSLVTDA